MNHLSRRALLAGLGSLAAYGLAGCQHATDRGALRLGYFPNVTHAPGLVGVSSGRFREALAGIGFETHAFNAGPEAMGALLAGALDMLYVGPVPAVTGYLRTRRRGLKIVSGVASGGASLIVRPAARITGPRDLEGKTLATPQLGNSQDLSLRAYLAAHGLGAQEWGGSVAVTPMRNALILQQFRRGLIDGAWVPEPWASRLEREAGGHQFLDERSLWPRGQFAAAVLVARGRYLGEARENVARLVAAHRREVLALRRDAARAPETVARALAAAGAPIAMPLLTQALSRVAFTLDPLIETVAPVCAAGQRLGLLPEGEIAGLADPEMVNVGGTV